MWRISSRHHPQLRLYPIALAAILLWTGICVPGLCAQPVFTGDAVADFAGLPTVIVVNDPGGIDVGVPAAAPPGTISGWDMNDAYLYYDPVADVLFVGIDCNGICGDADADGDGGTTSGWLAGLGGADLADYGGTELFTMIFDTNNNGTFDSGGPDVIIGISSLTTIAGLTAATFNGTEFAPGFAFGAPLPNAVTTFASPNGA
ncbi:MAG: hypothetical protein GY856_31340, partial [bacterium]|nr:hypothetical protein [bacterium]